MSYTVTDDHGVETLETQAELYNALLMRGVCAAEALSMLCRLALAEMDVQSLETP